MVLSLKIKKQKKSAALEEKESDEKQGILGANKKKSHKEHYAMLKIVDYSESENSVSPTKISSSVGHYGAVPLLPQNAHYDIHDTFPQKSTTLSQKLMMKWKG